MSQTKKFGRSAFLTISMIAIGSTALAACVPKTEAPTEILVAAEATPAQRVMLEATNTPPPLPIVKSDKFVDIGTHKLHVVLSDVQSEYTIVLEAGGGKYSESYQEIQGSLATLTGIRVMSYDRSGFGQSELGPNHFNAIDETEALKKLLEVQGFKDKFILVGLSYGGYLIQLFTYRYPELVSGLVLIDPFNICFVDRFGLDNINAVTPYYKNPTKNSEKAGNRQVDSLPESFEAMRGIKLPPQIPAILITSGNPPFSANVWRQCHEEMVMNSEKHQLIIAEGNNHDIVEENPELVLKTIIDLVNRIRSE